MAPLAQFRAAAEVLTGEGEVRTNSGDPAFRFEVAEYRSGDRGWLRQDALAGTSAVDRLETAQVASSRGQSIVRRPAAAIPN